MATSRRMTLPDGLRRRRSDGYPTSLGGPVCVLGIPQLAEKADAQDLPTSGPSVFTSSSYSADLL